MMKLRCIASLFVATAISSAAMGQMTLDLNPTPGDQGERERQIKPGETFSVELIAVGGAQGQTGFSIQLKFDTNQLNFKGLNTGGLMAGAMSMPPKPITDGVEISAAILGRTGAQADNGSLGTMLFETTSTLSATSVAIGSASFGSTAGIQEIGTGDPIKIVNPDAPTGPPPTGDTGQHDGPRGGMLNPPATPSYSPRAQAALVDPESPGGSPSRSRPRQGGDHPSQGGIQHPQPETGGFNNPPNQGGPPNQRGSQNPPGGNQQQRPSRPRQGGDHPSQGGIQHPQPETGGFNNPPNQGGPPNQRGSQNPPGGNQQQRPSRPRQGGDHPSQGGPPDIPVPAAEEAISKLPAPLQPSYNAALQTDIQTRPARHSGDPVKMRDAEKQMGGAIKVAMTQTIAFLGNASPDEASAVAGVIHFFVSGGQPDGPAPPGSEALVMAKQQLHDAENMIAGRGPDQRGSQNPPGGNQQRRPSRPRQGGGHPSQSGIQNPGQGGQQHGGGDHMNPEDMISQLPEALHPAFNRTMEVEHKTEKAHIAADLKMNRSVLATLKETKKFLAGSPNEEDRQTVGKVLWFFHTQDEDHGPGPGGNRPPQGMGPQGRGPGPGGMGQQGQGMPSDVDKMIGRMIKEIEREIEHLSQEL